MNYEWMIAQRLYRSNQMAKQVSKPAVRIAVAGIAVGLMIMILSIFVALGFKQEIRNKIIGFSSHVQIRNLSATDSYETYPIEASDSLMKALAKMPHVRHVERYSTKPGMIKTEDSFQGVVLEGFGPEYDPTFLKGHLTQGRMPLFTDNKASNEVIISENLAKKLGLKLDEKITCYFISTTVRARRFKIVGIYSTHLSQYDNSFVITDLYQVNRLNKWDEGQVSGMQIRLDDYERLKPISYDIARCVNNKVDRYGGTYLAQNVEQIHSEIFSWLGLLDINVIVILVLMLGVAVFTMISGLLILILERTNMIGLLKALGAPWRDIRSIFLYMAMMLIGKGMLIGNALALAFTFVQMRWGVVKLDADVYYLDKVPLAVSWEMWAMLNVAVFVIATFMMIAPSFLISKIRPTEAMRFE